MKKFLTFFAGLLIVVALSLSDGYSSKKLNKKHKKPGRKKGIRVSCSYCHKKAGVPKKKGFNKKKRLTISKCKVCHKKKK